jgi:succinoglycan biosynthesis protein ExoA
VCIVEMDELMNTLPQLPFVSVVMPIRDEAAFIHRSLDAVLAQDYPAEKMEVIVADGLSRDGTREIIESYMTAWPHLRLVHNPSLIVPTGLNAAIARARGDVIVRVDGHSEIAADYMRRCVAHLADDGVDVVGGYIEHVGGSRVAAAIAIAMSTPFGVGNAAFRTVRHKTMLVPTVPFPAYTRRIIEAAGPFDEELTRDSDAEYNQRLTQLGAKIMLAADVHARYFTRTTLRSLWTQYFQYGYWKVRLLQKHPRQMLPHHFVPPLFVASLLGSALLAALTVYATYALALVGGAYGAANLAASLWAVRRRGWSHLPLLPLAFATLHLSYGLGFLCGLVRFWKRWGDKVGKIPAWPTVETTSS